MQEQTEKKLKGVMKKALLSILGAVLPYLFLIILAGIVFIFMISPLIGLMQFFEKKSPKRDYVEAHTEYINPNSGFDAGRFFGSFGSCIFSNTCSANGDIIEAEQNVYKAAKEKTDDLNNKYKLNVDKYLAISAGMYGIDYNSEFKYDDEELPGAEKKKIKKYFGYAKDFINAITNPGYGLTKWAYFCTNKQTEVEGQENPKHLCISEKETAEDCLKTPECQKKSNGEIDYTVDRKLVQRTEEEFKKLIVKKKYLETHLEKLGYDLPTIPEKRSEYLYAAADELVERKDMYYEIYGGGEDSFYTPLSREEIDAIMSNLKYTKGSYKYPLVMMYQCQFNESDMCHHGCGPTSASVLLNTMLQTKTYEPFGLRDQFRANNLTYGKGTNNKMPVWLGNKYGITVEGPLKANEAQKLYDALASGNSMALAIVTHSRFYPGGSHYIVIYGVSENGNLQVFDEGCQHGPSCGAVEVPPEDVLGYLGAGSGFWIFTN